MTILIDKSIPERPKVIAIYPSKDEAIDAFFRYEIDHKYAPSPEEYAGCYKLLKKNKYVSGLNYTVQEF